MNATESDALGALVALPLERVTGPPELGAINENCTVQSACLRWPTGLTAATNATGCPKTEELLEVLTVVVELAIVIVWVTPGEVLVLKLRPHCKRAVEGVGTGL